MHALDIFGVVIYVLSQWLQGNIKAIVIIQAAHPKKKFSFIFRRRKATWRFSGSPDVHMFKR